MKKTWIGLALLVILGIIAWKFFSKKEDNPVTLKPAALAVSRHSDAFNKTMAVMLAEYYSLAEAFVNWDTTAINRQAGILRFSLDSLRLGEMEKDSAIFPTVQTQWQTVKSEIEGLQADEDIGEKRESFNMLSQQLFDLLRIVKYDASPVYYQECPMAMNNYESSAFWLSADVADNKRRNPYLGLHDPKYGKGMLICGSTRDSLHYNNQ
jgi:hypothetical protein